MYCQLVTRRNFSLSLAGILSGLGIPCRLSAVVPVSSSDIAHDAESIHQEITLKASRKRVYEALLDSDQFRKVTGGEAAEISPAVGGAFSCFGNRVSGRHIDLVSNERIVQAWRSNGWEPGTYSIVRFQFKEAGADTKIVFDHAGFPKGAAEHLATGWTTNYWDALERYFASAS
jgi:activator of HSP90 ATPase